MGRYILKRLLLFIPTVFGISVVAFILIHLAPGDPATAILGMLATPEMREQFRLVHQLNDPIWVQYGNWVWGVVQGDLGRSLASPVPVTDLLRNQFVPTVLLTAFSMMIAVPVAITVGVAAATRRGKSVDGLTRATGLIGLSMPSFWLGLLLILFFGVELRWLPVGGYVSPADDLLGCIESLALPALTLSLPLAAVISRITRATVLEILGKDYVRTARAMGTSRRRVLARHVLPNAFAPTLTTIGVQIGYLLGGAVLVESIFNLPGLGRLLVFAVSGRDYGVVQGIVLLAAVAVITVQLIVDIIIAQIDPRIRLQ
jgi:peptide/nickel transport system permease protein